MTSTSLTLRRQKFVSEYVETGNATQAARLAGYSPRTAYSQGSRLLTFVEVQKAIETKRQSNHVNLLVVVVPEVTHRLPRHHLHPADVSLFQDPQPFRKKPAPRSE